LSHRDQPSAACQPPIPPRSEVALSFTGLSHLSADPEEIIRKARMHVT
jgi:hypothetical protein